MSYENMLKEKAMDYTPRSTPGQLNEFMTTIMHQDFLNEIDLRIEQMRDYYEDCNKAEYLETRGGIKLLRMVRDIFSNLHDNAESDLESDDKENQDVETV